MYLKINKISRATTPKLPPFCLLNSVFVSHVKTSQLYYEDEEREELYQMGTQVTLLHALQHPR